MSTASATHTIRRIPFGEVAKASQLVRAHYDEVAARKDVMKLEPDWLRYEALERNGALICLGVFEGETLVGYAVEIIGPHLHYRNLLHGTNDVLFLDKEQRKAGLGSALIKQIEAESKSEGVGFKTFHAKPGTSLDRLLPLLGYEVHEVIYGKVL